MSVVPTSAAAALAASASASERASKVQTNAKQADQVRRVRNGQQAADRVVLSPQAVDPARSATDRPRSDTPDTQDSQHAHHAQADAIPAPGRQAERSGQAPGTGQPQREPARRLDVQG